MATATKTYHAIATVQLLIGEHTVHLLRTSQAGRAGFQIHIKDSPDAEQGFALQGHPAEALVLAEAIEWCRPKEHPGLKAESFDIWFGKHQIHVAVELRPEYHVVVETPHVTLLISPGHVQVLLRALRSLAAIRSSHEDIS